MHELEHRAEEYLPDVIAVTEVKPKRTLAPVQIGEYVLQNYYLFWNGNQTNTTRGINLYVRHGVEATLADNLCDATFIEALWVNVKLQHNKLLLLGCIYRSPNSPATNNNLLLSLFKLAGKQKASHKVIVGDFNLPGIVWSDGLGLGRTPFETEFVEALNSAPYANGGFSH